MLIYVAIFLAMNFALTFLVAPQYGVEIYGTAPITLISYVNITALVRSKKQRSLVTPDNL